MELDQMALMEIQLGMDLVEEDMVEMAEVERVGLEEEMAMEVGVVTEELEELVALEVLDLMVLMEIQLGMVQEEEVVEMEEEEESEV